MQRNNDYHILTLEDILASQRAADLINVMYLKIDLWNTARTKQEKQIIELLCKGYSRPEVAKKLKITRKRLWYVISKLKKRLES